MASRRRLRKQSCTGKVPHATQAAAQYHAAKVRAKGDLVRAYKCRFGDHWHIGHWRRGGIAYVDRGPRL